MIIMGSDSKNTILYDPKEDTGYKRGMNDSKNMFERAGNRFYALTARARGMRVLIRAEKYRREHGEFPKTLPDLPEDPFTGKPLVYEIGKAEVLETVWKKPVSSSADEVTTTVDAVSVRSPVEGLPKSIRRRGTDKTRAVIRLRYQKNP